MQHDPAVVLFFNPESQGWFLNKTCHMGIPHNKISIAAFPSHFFSFLKRCTARQSDFSLNTILHSQGTAEQKGFIFLELKTVANDVSKHGQFNLKAVH